jgi:hypothetical protein
MPESFEDGEPEASALIPEFLEPEARKMNSAREEHKTLFEDHWEEDFAVELNSKVSIDDEIDEKDSLNEQPYSKSKICLDLLKENHGNLMLEAQDGEQAPIQN